MSDLLQSYHKWEVDTANKLANLRAAEEVVSKFIEARDFLAAGRLEAHCRTSPTTWAVGYIEKSANPSGEFPGRIQDESGQNYLITSILAGDVQSDAQSITSDVLRLDVQKRTDSEIVQDEDVAISDRIDALHAWIAADATAAVDFIVEQLVTDQHDSAWLEALIVAADDVRFEDPATQKQVGNRLLQLAEDLRSKNQSVNPSTIWCAIHRGGSLIPVTDISQLEQFLVGQQTLDTRLVALQALVHIFEAESDLHASTWPTLVERIERIARAHLAEEVFASGEIAALALQGLLAIALIDPLRFNELSKQVRPLPPAWFRRQFRSSVQELYAPASKRILPLIAEAALLQ